MAQGLWTREYDGRAIASWLRARWRLWVFLAGAGLRLLEYLRNRSFWMDEASLSTNIVGHSFREPPAPMSGDQLAPYGFLVVERAIAGLLGPSPLSLRLVPLVAGLAAYWLLTRRVESLSPSARGLALALVACSGPLIYFTAELKPYIVDVAAACLCLSMPGAREFLELRGRHLVLVAALGAMLVWLSFPVAFVLAAVGLGWLGGALGRRSWALAWRAAIVISAWLASFTLAYVAAKRCLAIGTGMWAFWGFAFPPDGVLGTVLWTGRRFVNLFANPLHFDTPLGPTLSAVVGAALALVGLVSMVRREPELLARLIVPIALAWGAALVKFYPFHGRLLLFLVPSLYLLVSEGVGRIVDAAGWRRGRWLVAFVLVMPVFEVVMELLGPSHRQFSPHGDLRKNPWL